MDAGFITKESDPTDKRAYKIYLTPKAYKLQKDIKQTLRNWRNILLSDFTNEDKQQFIIFLHRTIDNAQAYLTQQNQLEH